eukprot:204577-Pleurochrysis_carterae.AAC.1
MRGRCPAARTGPGEGPRWMPAAARSSGSYTRVPCTPRAGYVAGQARHPFCASEPPPLSRALFGASAPARARRSPACSAG